METIISFDPVVGEDPKVLILGSMPGVKSLEINEYYGHRRNQFWKIMGDLFNFNKDSNYEERKDKLIKNKIALWDVIHSCVREGSLDNNIIEVETNNIVNFIREHPTINTVILNGGKAYAIYKKHFKTHLEHINSIQLYSTSPANTIKYEIKLEQWNVIKNIVQE